MKGALRLAAVDARACSLGLEVGLALADARARVPDLLVFDQDEHADLDWLERIADGCARYTPMVALDPPDGLILDISGCAHLFGGEAGLAGDAGARCARLGMTARHALASNPDAAHALARYQTLPGVDEAAAIRRLPVAALGLEGESTLGLERAGLKRVGALASRPMATIAARFGGSAVYALRRLLGETDSPITPRRVPPPIMVERRFAEPVKCTEYTLAGLTGLGGEAGQALEERKCGGRRFESVFFRSDGLARALRIETSQPTRDPKLVMRLFSERIEALSDPVDPGFGFDLIRLSVPMRDPLAATQLKLEGGTVGEAAVAALVDRLSTRLGRGRVRRLAPHDSHIPEQTQLALSAVEAAAPAQWLAPEPGGPPAPPLHLFAPPQPIEVIAEVPDGPPHCFRWRRALHEVRRFEGPERIASEWWRRKGGEASGGGLTRDYYRVEDARGRRFWIFRHGLYEERANPDWYIHGLFA